MSMLQGHAFFNTPLKPFAGVAADSWLHVSLAKRVLHPLMVKIRNWVIEADDRSSSAFLL